MLNTFLIKQFSVNLDTLNLIGANYDFSNGIPVFKTIHYLINNGYIYKKKKKMVFNNSLKFFNENIPKTLYNTSEKIGLTRERIRQIRREILNNMSQDFSFFTNFKERDLNLYNLDLNANIIDIDQELVEQISNVESVQYNKFFINRIFSIILHKKYKMVYNEKNVLFKTAKRAYNNYNPIYLISKPIYSVFNFGKMIDDISSRLSKKIYKEYKFNFQTYLLNFQKTNYSKYFNEIFHISKYIFKKFNVVINKNNIIFKQNGYKLVTDYIYEILDTAQKPLSVYEIFEILDRAHPGASKSAFALRGSCQREPRLICFGRCSTYGLGSWEQEYDNIKGGTMHDIAEDFLLKFNTPKHIDDIIEYVKLYRDNVTRKKLYNNLLSAKNKRFKFYEGNFISLCEDAYGKNKFKEVFKK